MVNKIMASSYKRLIADIVRLFEEARKALAEAYWAIGKQIVEVEQRGEIKGAYGSGLLAKLSEDLTRKCGSGFSIENLRKMRRVYLESSNQPPAADLPLTHYIEALPVRNVKKREFLIKRAVREGQAAKKFVESVLKDVPSLTVLSSKNATYDRYEADVFLPARSLKASAVLIPINRSGAEIGAVLTAIDEKKIKVRAGGTGATGPGCYTDTSGKEVFLNNLLLETGYAVRVRD